MKRILFIAIIGLVLLSIACEKDYGLDMSAPAVKPDTYTEAHKAYIDCMVTGSGIGDVGYADIENMHIWRTERCRLLSPDSLGLTTVNEVNSCIQEYGRWVNNEFDIAGFPAGWAGSRAMTAINSICAPSPPFGQSLN